MNALAQLPWRTYGELMRLDRPIGIWLLLWPTWWALWIAASGLPDLHLLAIFTAGVVVMRSAGCVINDWADRDIDRHVARTRNRPLTAGRISSQETLILFGVLVAVAFGLVLLTDPFTIALSLGGLALAAVYPFMKRITWWPQVVLGAAFSWAIPMAFAAQAGELPRACWLLFVANLLWTVAYDTLYAMADRDDDLQIGVKSTAILFGRADRVMVGVLQASTLLTLVLVGRLAELGGWFQLGLLAAAVLFGLQHWAVRHRDPAHCFAAFKQNHWVGLVIWLGLAVDLGTG